MILGKAKPYQRRNEPKPDVFLCNGLVDLSTSLFEEKICKLFPVRMWKKYRVCLAISGGPDSVALLRAMATIAEQHNTRKNLFVVTVNHGLRGKESDEEAIFVKDLAFSLGLPVAIKSVDLEFLKTEAQRTKSLENAARNARYQLLLETAERVGARYVLTAHHRDDQLETILFRLMRGAGPHGICGMEVFRPLNEAVVLARPLLATSRKEVLKYLDELNQDYKTDSSNSSAKYVRNRLRNELVPVLDSIFPEQWPKALLRHVARCRTTRETMEEETNKLEKELQRVLKRDILFRQTLEALRAYSALGEYNASQGRESVVFPLSILQQAREDVLCVFFRRVWNNQKWPVVNMGDDEWRRLAISIKTGSPTNQFPGNIILTFPDSQTVKLTSQR